MITEIFACVALVFFLLQYAKRRSSQKRFPPGPMGVPIFGYVPFLGTSNPFRALGELSKKYGDIFSIDFGPYRSVVLCSAELIREAGKKNEFAGRPVIEITKIWANRGTDKPFGIIINDGETWVEQRRFTVRHLRDFGFGKKSMEDLITNEVHDFLDLLRSKKNGEPILLKELFEVAVVNSLWNIVAGVRYRHDDPQLLELSNRMSKDFVDLGYIDIFFFFPRLAKFFPGYQRAKKAVNSMCDFLKTKIMNHKDGYVSSSPRNFMDVYLKEMEETVDPKSSFYKKTGELSMVSTILDLFAAGAETTSTALTWAFLYLVSYPEVQEKVLKELDEVVGKGRMPVLADRERLPYTEATIHETLRLSSLVPLLLLHNTVEDVEFHGFLLPKDTAVIMNAYHVMHDPDIWEHPNEFHPEHFLSPDGSFQSRDAFLPFGSGKRVCLGENLARMEIFLFLTSILHEFRLQLPPGDPKPSLNYRSPGFVIHPHPFHIILNARK